jgi:hypothetical protein
MLKGVQPIILIDQYILHSEEAPPRTDHFEALYVDANGNMFRTKGKTWTSALEALHQNLKQQGISLRDLPQPRKGETIHV